MSERSLVDLKQDLRRAAVKYAKGRNGGSSAQELEAADDELTCAALEYARMIESLCVGGDSGGSE